MLGHFVRPPLQCRDWLWLSQEVQEGQEGCLTVQHSTTLNNTQQHCPSLNSGSLLQCSATQRCFGSSGAVERKLLSPVHPKPVRCHAGTFHQSFLDVVKSRENGSLSSWLLAALAADRRLGSCLVLHGAHSPPPRPPPRWRC